jgi:antitoxin (DNA-binding transcriptional repressor) of toxin-antitoxin stability system
MKVKIGELKTHLSKYLRDLKESDEPIEVCVREDTVAYLTSAKAEDSGNRDPAGLNRRLGAAGITVSKWGSAAAPLRGVGRCGSPAGGPNSVETIRQERSY